jgi:hypothetical protein
VKDCGRAIALLMLAERLNHGIYNVSTGRLVRYREVVAAINAVVPGANSTPPEGRDPGRPPDNYLDTTRLQADTVARVGLTRGREGGWPHFACPRGAVRYPEGLTERSEGAMATDRRAEITASVAALQDLGSGYDQALAEGLVERIGAEIDQRIAAEIDNRVTAEVDARIVTQLDRYAGCRHQRRRARRMVRAERRAARAARADRPGRQSIMLALGSMLVALSVTAIVLKGAPGVAAIMLMALIWVIVGIINVAYAMRKHPQP